jgi:membrane fusion protein, copper/silver efflux system
MNTKKKSGDILFPVLLLLGLLFQQCNNMGTEHESHKGHTDFSGDENLEQVIASPNKQVLSRQATIKLLGNPKAHTLKAQGYVAVDENRNQSVSARFDGRIERLYVKYSFQYIKQGDKIFDLYSPELNTFQEEHLWLLKSGKENELLEQSRKKLRLLGLSDFQISQLEKNGAVTKTITVYSPVNGYVVFNTEANNNADGDSPKQTDATNMNMQEGGNKTKRPNSSTPKIRAGMYVNKGQVIFSVNDLQTVWAIASIPLDFRSALRKNSQVKIFSELFPDKPLTGTIDLIEPTFEESKQRFVRVRIAVPNISLRLKVNSLVTAELALDGKESFQIPSSALYRTGQRSWVWVKTGTTQSGTGIFQLRKVMASSSFNGMTTIVSGLSTNEEVAKHAGLLTDSESFLNSN